MISKTSSCDLPASSNDPQTEIQVCPGDAGTTSEPGLSISRTCWNDPENRIDRGQSFVFGRK